VAQGTFGTDRNGHSIRQLCPKNIRCRPIFLAMGTAGSVCHSINALPSAMEDLIPSQYYTELRQAVADLFELGLQVIPAINCSVDRDEYTGLEDFEEWLATGCDPSMDPEQFGLTGDEICGDWGEDGFTFDGFFPAVIRDDGTYFLSRKWREMNLADIQRQINLAEEYGHLLGIAVNTWTIKHILEQEHKGLNSVVYSDADSLRRLAGEEDIRIESDGVNCWSYAFTNFQSDDISDWFDGESSRCFGLAGSDCRVGWITKEALVPAYPSYVLGNQVKLISPGNAGPLTIQSAQKVGIHFDVDDVDRQAEYSSEDGSSSRHQADDDCSQWDESLEWSHTPDEAEVLFQQSLIEFEALLKPSKEIIRHQPPSHKLQQQAEMVEDPGIDLYSFVPQSLAKALSLVKENLPYDSLCVLVSFLTGLASMLRLGTTVTGNEYTDYIVPVNLYTILVAESGRKKSPLQRLFVDQPASDVMLKVDKENDRIMKAWREENGGKKVSEKTEIPVPIDIRVNDYTGEAFVQALGRLDEIGRAVLVEREEISALFQSLNAYKSGKGSDEQQLLELYDGGGFRSLRVGDKGRGFGRAAVNIFGTIQPAVLDALLRNGDASGLWARFSFAAMPDMTKRLPTKSDPEKLKAFKAAQQYLKDIISAAYELPAVQYKLNPAATELFADYEFKKQEDAQSTKISAQAALYGKAAGKVLRNAGALHITEIVVKKDFGNELISSATLRNAIELVDGQDRWTLACHAKLAGVTTEGLTPFQRRLHIIAFKSKSPMSWSDIRQRMSSTEKQGKDVKDAEEAMRTLVALGLGEVSKGPNGGLYYKALKPLPS